MICHSLGLALEVIGEWLFSAVWFWGGWSVFANRLVDGRLERAVELVRIPTAGGDNSDSNPPVSVAPFLARGQYVVATKRRIFVCELNATLLNIPSGPVQRKVVETNDTHSLSSVALDSGGERLAAHEHLACAGTGAPLQSILWRYLSSPQRISSSPSCRNVSHQGGDQRGPCQHRPPSEL